MGGGVLVLWRCKGGGIRERGGNWIMVEGIVIPPHSGLGWAIR